VNELLNFPLKSIDFTKRRFGGTYWSCDVLWLGRFGAWEVLMRGTFWDWDVLGLGRCRVGRFEAWSF
jgi:hypothetical protein